MKFGEFVGHWWKGEYDSRPIYYVYEWFDIKTGEVFYVGKGCGDRYRERAKTKRNRFFVNYVNAHECDVRFIKENLTEKEAFDLEETAIIEYKKSGLCKCNFADGGGKPSVHLCGELNPMYGKTHTPEVREIIRQANLGGRNAGKNNSQYGIPLRARMSEEQYQHWIEAHKIPYQGGNNPKARRVKMRFSDTKEVYKHFDCIKDCAIFLRDTFEGCADKTIDCLRDYPKRFSSPERSYQGFYFEIIKPNKDNTVPSSNIREGVTTNESVSTEKSLESKRVE